METSNPDKAKLTQLTKQISKLRDQMIDKRIDFQLAAKKIAPELNMQRGFGKKSRGKGSNRGGQGQGYGCGRF